MRLLCLILLPALILGLSAFKSDDNPPIIKISGVLFDAVHNVPVKDSTLLIVDKKAGLSKAKYNSSGLIKTDNQGRFEEIIYYNPEQLSLSFMHQRFAAIEVPLNLDGSLDTIFFFPYDSELEVKTKLESTVCSNQEGNKKGPPISEVITLAQGKYSNLEYQLDTLTIGRGEDEETRCWFHYKALSFSVSE
ncbi:hypothetical protein GYB22_11600 [bacterium]|nr:hypothetical protein [bacterium]